MLNNPNCTDNLKPGNVHGQTPKQAQINGSKGGKKQGENKRKRKSYKEILDLLQSCPIKKDQTISVQKEIKTNGDIIFMNVNLIDHLKDKYPNLSEEEINNATYASIKMTELINHSDAKVAIKAFEVVRDTVGEKPVDKQDLNTVTEYVYVDKKEIEDYDKHIDDVVNGKNNN